jgi:hypothetical protein
MIPMTSNVTVSPAQQYTQSRPVRTPYHQAARAVPSCVGKECGAARQHYKCRAFQRLNCNAPASMTSTPAENGASRDSSGTWVVNSASGTPSP